MYKLLFVYVRISIDELSHVAERFRLGEFFFNLSTEITFAKLSDDIGVVFGGVDFVKSKNIWNISHGFENLYLGSQERSVDFAFEHFKVDNLNCDRLLYDR